MQPCSSFACTKRSRPLVSQPTRKVAPAMVAASASSASSPGKSNRPPLRLNSPPMRASRNQTLPWATNPSSRRTCAPTVMPLASIARISNTLSTPGAVSRVHPGRAKAQAVNTPPRASSVPSIVAPSRRSSPCEVNARARAIVAQIEAALHRRPRRGQRAAAQIHELRGRKIEIALDRAAVQPHLAPGAEPVAEERVALDAQPVGLHRHVAELRHAAEPGAAQVEVAADLGAAQQQPAGDDHVGLRVGGQRVVIGRIGAHAAQQHRAAGVEPVRPHGAERAADRLEPRHRRIGQVDRGEAAVGEGRRQFQRDPVERQHAGDGRVPEGHAGERRVALRHRLHQQPAHEPGRHRRQAREVEQQPRVGRGERVGERLGEARGDWGRQVEGGGNRRGRHARRVPVRRRRRRTPRREGRHHRHATFRASACLRSRLNGT